MLSHVGNIVSPEHEVPKLMFMNSDTLPEAVVVAGKVHISWCASLVV